MKEGSLASFVSLLQFLRHFYPPCHQFFFSLLFFSLNVAMSCRLKYEDERERERERERKKNKLFYFSPSAELMVSVEGFLFGGGSGGREAKPSRGELQNATHHFLPFLSLRLAVLLTS